MAKPIRKTTRKRVAKAKVSPPEATTTFKAELMGSVKVENLISVAQVATLGLEFLKAQAREDKSDKEVKAYLKAVKPSVESFCKFVQQIDELVKRRQHIADKSEQVANGQNRAKQAAKSVAKKNKSTKKGAK